MSIYSSIDLETFKWVKSEVENTLNMAGDELQKYISSDDKECLSKVANHLHQVVGSLQMLEMRSLSALVMECEQFVEGACSSEIEIENNDVKSIIDNTFDTMRTTFARIESGLPDNPAGSVELINSIRAMRGLDGIEISSLFSPVIDIFPEIDPEKALKDKDYMSRARALRSHYQKFLLKWLRDGNSSAIEKMGVIFGKLLGMSTFGSAARLWWVAAAYADFIRLNNTDKQTVHSRVLRQVGDHFRDVETQGESALVRDSGDELVKIMLFYIGVGDERSERMTEIINAFNLQEYFPALKQEYASFDFDALVIRLQEWHEQEDFPLNSIRQLISGYFEDSDASNDKLDDISKKLTSLEESIASHDLTVIDDVVAQLHRAFNNIREGVVEKNEESGFYMASAFMYVESTVNEPEQVDESWLESGELKVKALNALNNQEELTQDLDGSQLSGQERQALLDVVGAEVEDNLKEIEGNLEAFAKDNSNLELVKGIDSNIRQVRGALQVLGEQKVGLLLKMAEEQFSAIDQGNVAATPELVEALAISIGTMEEYVKGLQVGRTGMDYLLDRSITDLEIAIGNILAKKTKLTDVELLVKEQDRLVDVIAQEPAFLTDNVTTTLQNNMVSIAEQIVTLYGTEETDEEIELDALQAYKKSAIESDDGPRFHDDMDVESIDDKEIAEAVAADEVDGQPSSTEVGKQNAVDENEAPMIDEAIFDIFVEESEEVLEMANEQYAQCLEDPNNRDAIRDLRRGFHTLKGSARMVGLNDAGEIAWFTESLFNYVLDTEKPLTKSVLAFSRSALDEFEKQVGERYQNQHLIDVDAWSAKTERVSLDTDEEIDLDADLTIETNDVEEASELEFVSEMETVSEMEIVDEESVSELEIVDEEAISETEC